MNNHPDHHLGRRRFLGLSVATAAAAALAASLADAALGAQALANAIKELAT